MQSISWRRRLAGATVDSWWRGGYNLYGMRSLRKLYIPFALGAVFLLLFPSAPKSSPDTGAETARRATIVFTGEIYGYVEPCG